MDGEIISYEDGLKFIITVTQCILISHMIILSQKIKIEICSILSTKKIM